MRLIDADKLFPYGSVPYVENDGFKTADKLYGIIKNAPTVDAVPVVHGRWLKNPSGFTNAICSCCVGDSPTDSRFKPIKTNYCPNCGAKMDGGDADV